MAVICLKNNVNEYWDDGAVGLLPNLLVNPVIIAMISTYSRIFNKS